LTYLDRTRTAYDTVAATYAELFNSGSVAESTWDRAVLGAYAEIVTGEVAEVGCGTGRITAHLKSLGVHIQGIDLSPGMISAARADYADIDFAVGSFLDLPLADGSLGGIVAWYSLVHTPPDLLPKAFAEFARVLAPDGRLVIAFKAGDDKRTLTSGYGHDIDLDVYDYPPDHMVARLAEAGLTETMRLVRAAEGPERQPQAYLMAVKASAGTEMDH
jgi:ubiquinone/menaquinone biosynthesis C-methylase UbiE